MKASSHALAPKSTPPIVAGVISVDAKQAAELLGIAERTFHNLRKRDDFPRPRDLSASSAGRVLRWSLAELATWFSALPATDTRPEPSQLAGRRYRSGKPVGQSAARSGDAQ